MKTLIDAIIHNPNAEATLHFIRGAQDKQVVSYAELKKRGLGLLAYFRERGVKSGDEVILVSQRNEAFLEGFWAAMFGGSAAVPLSFGIADEHKWKLFRVWRQLSSPWLMIDLAHVGRIDKFAETHGLRAEWAEIKGRIIVIEHIPQFTKEAEISDIDETNTAIIQFSSGTTSTPKGVVLSHKNLIANLQGIGEGTKMNKSDSTFSWMPLTHDMGLIGFHLTPLLFGIDQYLMPTDLFIRHPLLWLEKIAEYRATITCSPNFGYKHYLNALSRNTYTNKLDLSSLRLVLNGAEPISVPLVEAFMQQEAENGLSENSMFTVYGLAEASLAVAFPTLGEPFRYRTLDRNSLSPGMNVQDMEGGVPFAIEGRAIKGCSIRISDLDGQPLPADHIGKIEIKGENVTKGYLGQNALNATVIKDGWLDTGDLGLLTQDGELIVTGRVKDIIFINGQNYYPHDVEQVLEQHQLAEQGKVAVCGVRPEGADEDQILVFLVHKGLAETFYPQINPIKKLVNEQMGIDVKAVIPINKIPKTTSGKMQRYLLGEQYINGEFDEVLKTLGEWQKNQESVKSVGNAVEQSLQAICDELITDKKVGVDDNIFEIGTTSLILAQIHQRIEELYPGKVEVTDFFDYPTIKELATYIEQKK